MLGSRLALKLTLTWPWRPTACRAPVQSPSGESYPSSGTSRGASIEWSTTSGLRRSATIRGSAGAAAATAEVDEPW